MAIALAHSATNHNASAVTTVAVTVTSLTTGNYIVAAQSTIFATGAIYPTIDTGTIEWLGLGNSVQGAQLVTWFGRIITGGGTTLTFRAGSGGAMAGVVLEFSAASNLIVDRSVNSSGTVTAVTTGNAPATSTAAELWIGSCANRNETISTQLINGATPDNTYTDATTFQAGTSDRRISMAYKIVSSTGTPTPGYSATLSGTSTWNTSFFSIYEQPTGGNTYSISRVNNACF